MKYLSYKFDGDIYCTEYLLDKKTIPLRHGWEFVKFHIRHKFETNGFYDLLAFDHTFRVSLNIKISDKGYFFTFKERNGPTLKGKFPINWCYKDKIIFYKTKDYKIIENETGRGLSDYSWKIINIFVDSMNGLGCFLYRTIGKDLLDKYFDIYPLKTSGDIYREKLHNLSDDTIKRMFRLDPDKTNKSYIAVINSTCEQDIIDFLDKLEKNKQ